MGCHQGWEVNPWQLKLGANGTGGSDLSQNKKEPMAICKPSINVAIQGDPLQPGPFQDTKDTKGLAAKLCIFKGQQWFWAFGPRL